ncbi:MAG: hypothetical protein ABL925_15560, partial [Methylococcales bacterium]
MTQPNSKPSFNLIDGTVINHIDSGSFSGKFVTYQADGKMLVTGQGGANDLKGHIVLTRYNSDGSLDTSFNGTGTVISSIGNAFVQTVLVEADGSIAVSGRSDDSNDKLGFVLRYHSDGSLNNSPASGAFLVTAPITKSSTNTGTDVGLFRYTGSNLLDSSFGNGGGTVIDVGTYDTPRFVTAQTDGKILVAGGTATDTSSGDFLLLRYNSNGFLDNSFGVNGIVKSDFNGKDDYISSIATQADGKILVVGSSGSNATGYSMAIARYNSDGSLDTSFSGDGKLSYSFDANSDYAESVAVQADGKILVAGETLLKSSNYHYALLRLNTDGSLDTSFSDDGVVISQVSANSDFAYDVTVDAFGKILLTGGSNIMDANRQTSELALVRYNTDGTLDSTFIPVNTLDAQPNYSQNGSAVVMDNNVRIRDAELDLLNNYNAATLTLARQGG